MNRSPLNHRAHTAQNITEMKAQYTPKKSTDGDYNPVFDNFKNTHQNPFSQATTLYSDTVGMKKYGVIPESQKPKDKRIEGV